MKRKYILSAAIAALMSCACSASNSSLEDAYSSMALANDDALYGAPTGPSWSRGASIVQGIPRGDATPIWWADNIVDKSITDSDPWNAMTVWFTGFEAQSNKNSDIQVALGKPEVWLLRTSKKNQSVSQAKWERLPEIKFNWSSYFTSDVASHIKNADASYLNDGTLKYKISQDHFPTHGGTPKIEIDGNNVLGVFVRVKAWLEPKDASHTNNISNAKYLVNVGVDYYPTVNHDVAKGDFAGLNYLPGAFGSRFSYVTATPKWLYATSVAPANTSIVDKSSQFIKNGGKTYLTHQELLQNPPHLN